MKGTRGGHHVGMVTDCRQRFFICLPATLLLFPMLQFFTGLELRFPGDLLLLFGLPSLVFLLGGWPFLKGTVRISESSKEDWRAYVGT